jgi:hypothetical protein
MDRAVDVLAKSSSRLSHLSPPSHSRLLRWDLALAYLGERPKVAGPRPKMFDGPKCRPIAVRGAAIQNDRRRLTSLRLFCPGSFGDAALPTESSPGKASRKMKEQSCQVV